MPPGRKQQSNAMLYTLVVFIGLFIAATTVAVIYYVKAEDNRIRAADLEKERDDLASSTDVRNLGKTVGSKPPRTTWISLMNQYLNESINIITGPPVRDTSAEVKVANARDDLQKVLQMVSPYVQVQDVNSEGLVPIISKLENKLSNTLDAAAQTSQQLAQLQAKFDDAIAAQQRERELLAAEKQKLQQQVNEIDQRYVELEALLKQTADERAETLMVQLDSARESLKETEQTLLKRQAELGMAQEELEDTKTQLFAVNPPPDANAPAYKPDGRVLLVDDLAKIAHLDIGSDQLIYKGLTFSVYDRGASISRETKPKAELEVFDIAKNHSAARITSGSFKKPILEGDIVANVIWDAGRAHLFAVAGDFDLDRDGMVDPGSAQKIRDLVKKWGAKAAEKVSSSTDFLVLGDPPAVPTTPTFEDLDIDPSAQARYDEAVQRLKNYEESKELAKTLWIPVFKYDTLLDFIGYNSQIKRPGAFSSTIAAN